MGAPGTFFGRAARTVLIAAGIVAWAYALGLVGGLRTNAAAQSVGSPGDAHNPRNLVFTADHAVFTTVGDYSDCTGRTQLTHAAAAIDSCVPGVRYFIGHNPGVFTGLMSAGVGSRIGYYDASGRLHTFQVVAERTWLRSAGVPPPVRAGEAAQFQTCLTADGSVDRILDAVET